MKNALCASQRESILRIAAASPLIRPADIDFNTEQIIETIKKADGIRADYLALPELCLTGATLGALYDFDVILKAASDALLTICKAVQWKRLRKNSRASSIRPERLISESRRIPTGIRHRAASSTQISA